MIYIFKLQILRAFYMVLFFFNVSFFTFFTKQLRKKIIRANNVIKLPNKQ